MDKPNLHIVPVQGKDVLYAPSEVVRLGEKRLLQSEADWEFLAAHLLVLNQNWPRFLAEQRRVGEEGQGEASKKEVEAAFAVLKAIGLDDTSDVSKVVEQVATEFFAGESLHMTDCIQLTQIAAKLGATIGAAFRFATQDLSCAQSTRLFSTIKMALYKSSFLRNGAPLTSYIPTTTEHLPPAHPKNGIGGFSPDEQVSWGSYLWPVNTPVCGAAQILRPSCEDAGSAGTPYTHM